MKNKVKHKKTVQNYYSKRAENYDSQKARTWKSKNGFSPKILKEIMKAASEAKFGWGLEVGIGSGRISFPLTRKTKLHIVGIDISKEMLKLAIKKARGKRSLSLVQADAEFLPFCPNAFSLLICVSTFHYFPSQRNILTEFNRVLKKDGIFIHGDITLHEEDSEAFMETLEKTISLAHKKYFKPSEMKMLLENFGIQPKKVVTISYKKTYEALWEDKAKYFNIKPQQLYETVACASTKEKALYEIGLKDIKLFYTLIIGRKN